ncbi:MAG: hypothetical protein N0E48_07945, partial [Candidatus Thiodiazotropha endolucinida]|nr:hypothetical protein [Candidatus Thiodiazotropha taylori]MCW4343278.1 hypothetical protein [Candidatus Thiodiazotropha endolucinida]
GPTPANSTRQIIDFETILRNADIEMLRNGQQNSFPSADAGLDVGNQLSTTHSSDLGVNAGSHPPGISVPLASGLSSSGLQETDINFGEQPVRLGSDDLSAHVPLLISQKIWSHQYININLLLKGAVRLQEICSGGNLHVNKQGFLEAKPLVFKDPVPNVEKWTDAFLILTSIYLKKYPGKAQELLQYTSIIREAAVRSPASFAWRDYDEQFRLRQANNVQPLNRLTADLWLRVMTLAANALVQSEPSLPSRIKCLDFNHGVCNFQGCKYLHVCSHCGGSNHGHKDCFKLTPPSTSGGLTFRGGRGQVSNRGGGQAAYRGSRPSLGRGGRR